MYGEHIIPAIVHRYTQVLQRPDLIWRCTLSPIGTAAGRYNCSDEDIPLDLNFFIPFEELRGLIWEFAPEDILGDDRI
jgi:hypothetical protein